MFHSRANSLSHTPVFILAGGRGDRLFPLTVSRPKPLLPLGLYRIIDFTLQNCERSGLVSTALLTQYQHERVLDHICRNWNDRFRCLPPVRGTEYRGTADAVFQNLAEFLEHDTRQILVLSADHVYRMDYRRLLRNHVETDADVTLSTIPYPLNLAGSFGVVEVNEQARITRFQEKPLEPRSLPHHPGTALVSMGIYVFRTRILADALSAICGRGRGFDFGHDLLPHLIGSVRVHSCEFRNEVLGGPCYWRDVGTLDTYYDVCLELAGPNAPYNLRSVGVSTGEAVVPMADVHRSARVSRTMMCGGVHVEEYAQVEDSVLMPGVRIGKSARIRRAIVDEGMQIPANFTVGHDAQSDRHRHWMTHSGLAVVSASLDSARPRSFPISEKTWIPGAPIRTEH